MPHESHDTKIRPGDELSQIKTPEVMAENLGFKAVEEEEPEEGKKAFALPIEIPQGKGEMLITFQNVKPEVAGESAQKILLGVRIPGTELVDESIFPMNDTYAGLGQTGNGITTRVLENGGYAMFTRVLQAQLEAHKKRQEMQKELAEPDEKQGPIVDEQSEEIPEDALILGVESYLEKLYKDKAALEKADAERFNQAVVELSKKFPHLAKKAEEGRSVYLYGETKEGKIPALRITNPGRGFELGIGTVSEIKIGQKTQKATVKGKDFFTLSSIGKYKNDWLYGSWEYGDLSEAITYAKAIEAGKLGVDKNLLSMPATWHEPLGRIVTLEEVLAYQKVITGGDMKFPLPKSPVSEEEAKKKENRLLRSFALPEDQLKKLTLARLERMPENITLHTGETVSKSQAIAQVQQEKVTELGKKIMRDQVVNLEIQISQLQTDRYEVKDESLKKQ